MSSPEVDKLAFSTGTVWDTTVDSDISQDFRDLCYACRVNDLEQVKLYMTKGVNVNRVDEWDNSPLILASLCGHERIVRYLLENGAICERNTFEGERCIYGALTDTIRNLLIQFNISKAISNNQSFVSYISFLHFKSTSLSEVTTVDLSFSISNDRSSFGVHRFILCAWSDYFKEKLTGLAGEWRTRKNILLKDGQFSYDTFEYLFKILYLNTSVANFHDKKILQLTKDYELNELNEYLEELINSKSTASMNKKINQFQNKLYDLFRLKLELFMQKEIIGKKIRIPLISTNDQDSENKDEDEDDEDLDIYKSSLSDENRLELLLNSSVPDVILAMKDEENHLIYFPVHRAILCRCLYYKTLFESSIGESNPSDNDDDDDGLERGDELVFDWPRLVAEPKRVTITPLSFTKSIECTEIILNYLYCDNTAISTEIAMEVLLLADALLIDKMKWAAAIELTKSLDYSMTGYSIYEILRAGWLTNSTRIEEFAAKVFANDLSNFIKAEDFREIVLESANRIQDRQETDTIELIDDIRYHLTYHKYGLDFSEDPTLLFDVSQIRVSDEGKDGDDEEEADEVTTAKKNKKNKEEDEILIKYNEYLQDLQLIDGLLETLKLDA